MNSSSMISKICLSLKSLECVDFKHFASYIQNIEFRLDSINIHDIDLESVAGLFQKVILKIENLEQIETIGVLFDLDKLSNKIIYDIDYNDYMKYTSKNKLLLDNYYYILSIHNLKYDEIINYFNLFQNLDNIHKYNYIKIVIYDNSINYNRKLLYAMYNIHKNQYNNLICFFEGEDYIMSRYHSIILGSPFLYCGLSDTLKTGIGQPTIADAIRMIKLLGSFCKNIDAN